MTRDQLRALWLHRAIAAKVAADPARVLAQAKSTANSLLDRGPEAVMRTLVSTDPLARELRPNSPFAGVLSTSEREAILRAASRLVKQRDFLVIGSATILGTYSKDVLPRAANRSEEAGEGDFSAGHPGPALASLPPGSASGPDRRPGAPPGAHTPQRG
jgi:hypothetical protein